MHERLLPFRTIESPGEPHPGLRAYPFLGQVRGQQRQWALPAVRWPCTVAAGTDRGMLLPTPHQGPLPYLPLSCFVARSPAPPWRVQVCRRWKALMDSPSARQALWCELVIDFGHELITAVHSPAKWADTLPSDAEFDEVRPAPACRGMGQCVLACSTAQSGLAAAVVGRAGAVSGVRLLFQDG